MHSITVFSRDFDLQSQSHQRSDFRNYAFDKPSKRMVRKRTDKPAAFMYSVQLDKNILSAKGESLMALAHRPSFSTGWQLLYECAILELDGSLLPDRIDVARRAMLDRVEEVLKEPSGEEHRALSNALHTLQILEEVAEREKIRYEEN